VLQIMAAVLQIMAAIVLRCCRHHAKHWLRQQALPRQQQLLALPLQGLPQLHQMRLGRQQLGLLLVQPRRVLPAVLLLALLHKVLQQLLRPYCPSGSW
jgi:hypothetical protein